jgi:hypothetical protein
VSTHIGSRKLLPRLYGETSQSTSPHAAVDKLPPSLGRESFRGKDGDDFLVLGNNIWVLKITVCLDMSKNVERLINAVYFDEPSRTLW